MAAGSIFEMIVGELSVITLFMLPYELQCENFINSMSVDQSIIIAAEADTNERQCQHSSF